MESERMKTALLRRDADGAAALAARCNEHTLRFGLALTETDALRLLAARERTLCETGRVEFGGGVLEALAFALSDSPYLDNAAYPETLETMQELFNYFKGECAELLTDEELIAALVLLYNEGVCGSAEAMYDLDRSDVYRAARMGSLDGTVFDRRG